MQLPSAEIKVAPCASPIQSPWEIGFLSPQVSKSNSFSCLYSLIFFSLLYFSSPVGYDPYLVTFRLQVERVQVACLKWCNFCPKYIQGNTYRPTRPTRRALFHWSTQKNKPHTPTHNTATAQHLSTLNQQLGIQSNHYWGTSAIRLSKSVTSRNSSHWDWQKKKSNPLSYSLIDRQPWAAA